MLHGLNLDTVVKWQIKGQGYNNRRKVKPEPKDKNKKEGEERRSKFSQSSDQKKQKKTETVRKERENARVVVKMAERMSQPFYTVSCTTVMRIPSRGD